MTHPVGTLKLVLQNYWTREGKLLMANNPDATADAPAKRLWIGRYIDGESPSSHAFVNKWLEMSEEEKALHLKDAFPGK